MRNKTLTIEAVCKEEKALHSRFFNESEYTFENIECKIICDDTIKTLDKLPDSFVDLLIVDPPYNLSKTYNSNKFNKKDAQNYCNWFEEWVMKLPRLMKPNGSLYFCGDWQSSPLYYQILTKYFCVKNRITWEREKGRGASANWKNNIEDIYFCTMNEKQYQFYLDRVKIKKKVIAPYRDESGNAKDWFEENGEKYRYTAPSNVWTDITVPYWSMPENTEHPTQKPEKLIAKLILASSNEGDMVFDPFAGSGTTLVTAKKLNRRFCGIEREEEYCLLTSKRLEMAENDKRIQGYENGMFLERNSK